jgi:hypothetical protein
MYCFTNDVIGHTLQRAYPVGQAPKKIRHEGHVWDRDYAAESVGVPPTKGWPIECLGSGVNAAQAGELRQHFKDVGVPTEVTPDGNPVYRDAGHRRKALKARGFVDKASYV